MSLKGLVLVAGFLSFSTGFRLLASDDATPRSLQIAENTWMLWRKAISGAVQAEGDGSSYVSVIPYVTRENDTRTNLGLNNFSQFSLMKGTRPDARVTIGFIDGQGNLERTGSVSVRSNELLQLSDVIGQLTPLPSRGSAETGWLLIFSDEPLTAWASVIFNSSGDPSIELAIADQIYKPAGYVESQGTPANPLIIQSSVKSGTFQSSLVVVNVGSGDGILGIKLFDSAGNLLETKSASIKSNGMYVSEDIRSTQPGSFGQIVVEVADPNPGDSKAPRIVANSIVKNPENRAAFFPAFALPQTNTRAVAGRWEGTLQGGLINAQARLTLYQERDMLYGSMEITGGNFPTARRRFQVSGEVVNNGYVLQAQEAQDSDASRTFFVFRMIAPGVDGTSMSGDTLYFDKQDRRDMGRFSLTRTGATLQ